VSEPAPDIEETADEAPPHGMRAVLATLARAPHHAIAGDTRGRAFWSLAGVVAAFFLLLILAWPLGGGSWLFPPRYDADQSITVPSPPLVTVAEQLYLRDRYPDLARGFDEPPLQPWTVLPRAADGHSPVMIDDYVLPKVRAAVITLRRDATAAELLQAKSGLDDAVDGKVYPKGKAHKPALAVLYHRALVLIRLGHEGDLSKAKDDLDAAENLIGRFKDGASERKDTAENRRAVTRVAGAEIAILAAHGEVNLKQGDAVKALADFDHALALVNEGRDGAGGDLGFVTFDPNESLIDWDSATLWDRDLAAARRAGNRTRVLELIAKAVHETSQDLSTHKQLAVNLQTAAAYFGDPNVAQLQVEFVPGDADALRTASYAARFMAGAAPVAGQSNGPPIDVMKPWILIDAWRNALREAITGKALFEAFDAPDRDVSSDTPPLPAVRHELMDFVGQKMVRDGIGGSSSAGYGFVLRNKGQFSAPFVWTTAVRNTFFGAPQWAAITLSILISLVLVILGVMTVWWLEVLRKSYQLTFTPYHWNDRRRAAEDSAPEETQA
jgi:hypothetical protein